MSTFTKRLEQEHVLLCSEIRELQMKLEDANQRREEIRKTLRDREFIDQNVDCALEWLGYTPVPGHNWKSRKNICATMTSLLGNMDVCKCCERHMSNRPTKDDICHQLHYESNSSSSLVLHQSNIEHCDCMCRHVARKLQHKLYTFAMETESETDTDDSV